METPVPLATSTPKVSVAMITYNHARFIRQAVESVANQEADFSIEAIVGDDYSTDGTREILLELQRVHPQRIFPLLHPKNLGEMGKPNFLAVLGRLRGDYFAFLEGDDFWNHPRKLAEQVAFLESHREFSGVCHDAHVLRPGGQLEVYPFRYPVGTDQIGPKELLRHGFPHSTTLLVRRECLLPLASWYSEMVMGDWPMTLQAAMTGPIAYFRDQRWTTYRADVGYWLGRSLVERTRQEMRAYEVFGRVLGPAYATLVRHQLHRRLYFLAEGYLELGQTAEARAAYGNFLRGWPRHRSESIRRVGNLGIRLFAPHLYRRLKTLLK